MRADRDEYKWIREATAGQKILNKRLVRKPKFSLRLVDFLGILLVGISLAFIALAMFK